jgi:hypothetical protein
MDLEISISSTPILRSTAYLSALSTLSDRHFRDRIAPQDPEQQKINNSQGFLPGSFYF